MTRSSSAGTSDPGEAASAAVAAYLARTPDAELGARLNEWSCPPPIGSFTLGPSEVAAQDVVNVTLWDSHEAPQHRWPYRARVLLRNGEWLVQRVDSQCTSCFGTGWLPDEDRQCDTCDGSGWGVCSDDAQSEIHSRTTPLRVRPLAG